MSFLGGLFTGNNSTENGTINQAGGIASFGTAVGEGDVGQASDFYSTLLGGNEADISKLLAPQISNITGQAQQQKDTMAQFGNRSGGTNSQAQTIDDTTRSNIDNMISQLTGQAASGLGQLGTTEQSLGLSANQIQNEEAQQKMQNQQNSILGGLITGGIGQAAGYVI